MKINIDKNLVEFKPENQEETTAVEKLWRILIDCVSDSRKLAPVGEYVPSKKNAASFYIEGLQIDDTKASQDGVYYCNTCNKSVNLNAGDEIPLCCGKKMELID